MDRAHRGEYRLPVARYLVSHREGLKDELHHPPRAKRGPEVVDEQLRPAGERRLGVQAVRSVPQWLLYCTKPRGIVPSPPQRKYHFPARTVTFRDSYKTYPLP